MTYNTNFAKNVYYLECYYFFLLKLKWFAKVALNINDKRTHNKVIIIVIKIERKELTEL